MSGRKSAPYIKICGSAADFFVPRVHFLCFGRYNLRIDRESASLLSFVSLVFAVETLKGSRKCGLKFQAMRARIKGARSVRCGSLVSGNMSLQVSLKISQL